MPKTTRKATKRGAPKGNRNASGPHRRRTPTQDPTPLIQPGTEDDPVLQGFEAKKTQVTEQFTAIMEGIANAAAAYMTSIGSLPTLGRGTPSPSALHIPMNRDGTPNMRTKLGREFMESHPHYTAPRAD